MPRAFCYRCNKYVNATPSGSGIIGAYKVDLPGPVDIIVPVKQRYQSHYCPNCGTQVVTEENIAKMESDSKLAQILKPFIAVAVVLAIISFAYARYDYTNKQSVSIGDTKLSVIGHDLFGDWVKDEMLFAIVIPVGLFGAGFAFAVFAFAVKK
jgi:hypothetical protein